MTTVSDTEYPFALCLTHDVDRPYKTAYHALFYTVTERQPRHLRAVAPSCNPYWQFETVMELEADLGVRSAFYFLNEPPLRKHTLTELTDSTTVIQKFGRYTVENPDIADVMKRLNDGGWEVGLHGSYRAGDDKARLDREKTRIERVLGQPIRGGRQHYLNHTVPETWHHYRDIGLRYDATLGSTTDYGFHYGYDVLRPFDDEFAVFPLTLMEHLLPDPGTRFSAARDACDTLLEQAAAHDAVMSALFHPRYFSETEFPGYRRLYRYLVERALERGAWVGSPGEFYDVFLAEEERTREMPADSGSSPHSQCRPPDPSSAVDS